jgi:hypothetical protein
METEWEFACFKGDRLIGIPGTFEEASAVCMNNYTIALNAGDRSRYDYHLRKRRVARGPWILNTGS